MFAVFPDLLFLAPLSASLLRVTLALILLFFAITHVRQSAARIALAIFEIAAAASLAVGAWVQPVALGAFVLLAISLFTPSRPLARSTILVSLVLCISLLMTGAGALAFDLPL